MAVTVIGGSFRAKLDLWLSGPSLLSLCICFVWVYYVEVLSFFHRHQCKCLSLLCYRCSLHTYKSHVQTHVIPFTRITSHACWMWTLIQNNCDYECDWLYCLRVFWQLASGIYSFACSLWSHHTDCFLQQIYARDEAVALGSLERTLLSLKGSNICTHANLHMPMPPLHSHTKWCKWSINKES